MAKFRDVKSPQKFAAVHASIDNHFNQDRHLNRRDIFKQNRSTALAEWRQLAAAGGLSASDRHPSQVGSGLSDSAADGAHSVMTTHIEQVPSGEPIRSSAD